MKVLIMHNDLRAYWKRRLIFLHSFLKEKGIDLYAVELFGKGSPYDFDPFNKSAQWWDCLFPEQSNIELSKQEISNKVFSKLDEVNADVIIAGSIVFYSGALGLRWAKRNKKKFIMFDDAKPSWVKRNLLVQGIKNIITRQIDALWLPSAEYNKEYEKLYSNKKIHYLYGFNCVDNEWFKFGVDKRFDNRKIICVGRLVPKKNIQNLLSAWKFVNQKNDTNSLVILGDGPLMPDLKDFVKSNNIGNVEFLGAVENDKIPQYLYMADAFISPSLYESWGLVVNEAMAAGLPVLLSDKINAAFTLLEEGINGYMFDPYNQEQMQQKLINYINLSESQKKEMSENSLRMISSMSYENMGRALLEVLDKLKNEGYRRPGLVALMAINSWSGRYNTFGWDNV